MCEDALLGVFHKVCHAKQKTFNTKKKFCAISSTFKDLVRQSLWMAPYEVFEILLIL